MVGKQRAPHGRPQAIGADQHRACRRAAVRGSHDDDAAVRSRQRGTSKPVTISMPGACDGARAGRPAGRRDGRRDRARRSALGHGSPERQAREPAAARAVGNVDRLGAAGERLEALGDAEPLPARASHWGRAGCRRRPRTARRGAPECATAMPWRASASASARPAMPAPAIRIGAACHGTSRPVLTLRRAPRPCSPRARSRARRGGRRGCRASSSTGTAPGVSWPMSRNTCGWSKGGRAPMHCSSLTPMKIFSAPRSLARWGT